MRVGCRIYKLDTSRITTKTGCLANVSHIVVELADDQFVSRGTNHRVSKLSGGNYTLNRSDDRCSDRGLGLQGCIARQCRESEISVSIVC